MGIPTLRVPMPAPQSYWACSAAWSILRSFFALLLPLQMVSLLQLSEETNASLLPRSSCNMVHIHSEGLNKAKCKCLASMRGGISPWIHFFKALVPGGLSIPAQRIFRQNGHIVSGPPRPCSWETESSLWICTFQRYTHTFVKWPCAQSQATILGTHAVPVVGRKL